MSIYEKAKEITKKAGFWIEGTQLDYQVSGPIKHFGNPLELDVEQWASVLECVELRQHELDVLMGPKPAGAGMTTPPCLCGLHLRDLVTTDQKDIWAALARANHEDLAKFYACPVVAEVPTTVADQTEVRLACACKVHAALVEHHVLCRDMGVHGPLFVKTDLRVKRVLFELGARDRQAAPAGFRAETADQAPVITTCGVVGYASKRRKTVGPMQLPAAAAPGAGGKPEPVDDMLGFDPKANTALNLPLPKGLALPCFGEEGGGTPWFGSPVSGADELFMDTTQQEMDKVETRERSSSVPSYFGGGPGLETNKLFAVGKVEKAGLLGAREGASNVPTHFGGSPKASANRLFAGGAVREAEQAVNREEVGSGMGLAGATTERGLGNESQQEPQAAQEADQNPGLRSPLAQTNGPGTTLAVWTPCVWDSAAGEFGEGETASTDASEEGDIVAEAASTAGVAPSGEVSDKSVVGRIVGDFNSENSLLAVHSPAVGRGMRGECAARLDRAVKCECSMCMADSARLNQQEAVLRRLIEAVREQEEG